MTTWTQTAADHVSEREAGAWVDCVPSSGVEFARAGGNDRAIPATNAEREALRAAMGLPADHQGATLAQLSGGLQARYGFTQQCLTRDWPTIAAHLGRAGTVAVITGKYGTLPVRFRRWDPGFTGAHAVAVYGGTVPWWCDPLAPKGTYRGEPIAMSTLRAYYEGYDGAGALLADVGELSRVNMAVLYNLSRWTVPAGCSFYEAPNGAKIGTFSAAMTITALGPPLDHSTDGIDTEWRACFVPTGAMTGTQAQKLVYVRKVDMANVPTDEAWDAYALSILLDPSARPPTPDTTPYDQDDLDASRDKALVDAEAAIEALRGVV